MYSGRKRGSAVSGRTSVKRGAFKAKSDHSKGKIMTTVMQDAKGVGLVNFLENKRIDSTINQEETAQECSFKKTL